MTDAPDLSAEAVKRLKLERQYALDSLDAAKDEITRLRAEIAAAERKGAEDMRAAAKAVTDRWLAAFGDHEIHFTSAREYACAAITDATELIAALPLPPSTRGGE